MTTNGVAVLAGCLVLCDADVKAAWMAVRPQLTRVVWHLDLRRPTVVTTFVLFGIVRGTESAELAKTR